MSEDITAGSVAAPVAVRRATAADIPQIIERWRELMEVHVALESELFALAEHASETYAASIRGQLGDRDRRVLVIDEPGRAGGLDAFLTAGLGMRAPIFARREIGMVFDVGVRPSARRRGLGQALVASAERWFVERQVSHFQVDFSPANALAAGFWTARGYVPLLAEAYRRP